VVTTTPRPIKLLRQILARPDTVVTRGTTYDNRANLAPAFFQEIIRRYEGTRLGRQELKAELLDEVPGALWNRGILDDTRREEAAIPDLQRVVVGVDPAISMPDGDTELEGNAETGIMVVGLGVDGRGYVLADLSCRLGPDGWARRAVSGIDLHDGDAIVAETNQGGAMVARTIRSVRPTVKIIEVHASRGKVTRAEPVAALYEQGRVSHVGSFPELEDQMMLFTSYGIEGETTADRVDALVWALTELFPRMLRSQKRKSGEVEHVGVRDYSAHGF
jgi:phage terminase large subunit-like protein